MLHSLPPQSMYPPSGVHFRNPFNPKSSHSHALFNNNYNLDTPSPSSGYSKTSHTSRGPLSPPPEMNTVARSFQHAQHPYYGQRLAAPHAKHESSQVKHEQGTYGQNQTTNGQPKQEVIPQQGIKARSPVFTQNPNTGVSRKDAQNSSIAPSLQIPRSVNNSKGSLAELAAQITCLFWFESSATLELAERSTAYEYPLHSLVPDAIPTTGFRKWVTTILSTTQVAQNVIILALLFIYRLKKLNPTVKGKPGSEYRLLTVALMLGNKFLDDNTYTNKTWAEVSGISVSEVHIMEVEFLSNMKYALFTSAEEWDNWQALLGRFANLLEQTSSMPAQQSAAGTLGITLPSPPTSNHASPPYSTMNSSTRQFGVAHSLGSAPNLSPMGHVPTPQSQGTRKRSLDASSSEPPAKRPATSNSNYGHTAVPSYNSSQFLPRVPLPSLAIAQPQQTATHSQAGPKQQQHQQFLPQLPPLNYSQRSFPASQTPTTTWAQSSSVTAPTGHYSQPKMQISSAPQSLPQSRHQSPYPGSAGVSPIGGAIQSAGQAHASQLSPTYYLEQRNSPYRPICGVSTLLVPPPQRTRDQPQNVGREQMHYQPLGRPQERQTGQLPYIAQNQWFDGQHQSSASAYQWPSFLSNNQQQIHSQLPLPTPSFGRT